MKHLDLFSGIGGASLALDRVFGKVEHIFVENDPFCQEALKKHWPEATYFGDIRKFTADAYFNGRTGGNKEINSADPRLEAQRLAARRNKPPFILTGGFPCQPFSQAGRRKGTEDDRYLWPEMLRVIREFRPRWIVGENVAGLVTWSDGLVLKQIVADLEAEGYEVGNFIIPAVAVNAPHRRDRVWIVAKNTKHSGSRKGEQQEPKHIGNERNALTRNGFGLHSQETQWKESWLEVATRLCRVDDGLPAKLDEFELSKSRHRIERLKALGNAWVPQVAEEIFNAIKQVEIAKGCPPDATLEGD